jgi:hypothetical protein
MADPQRVKRLLNEGWERWRKTPQPKGLSLREFNEQARAARSIRAFAQWKKIPPRLLGRWMREGVAYPGRDKTAKHLRDLCEVWGIVWEDLWAEQTVALSVDAVAEAIRLLDEVTDQVRAFQKLLQSSLNESRRSPQK